MVWWLPVATHTLPPVDGSLESNMWWSMSFDADSWVLNGRTTHGGWPLRACCCWKRGDMNNSELGVRGAPVCCGHELFRGDEILVRSLHWSVWDWSIWTPAALVICERTNITLNWNFHQPKHIWCIYNQGCTPCWEYVACSRYLDCWVAPGTDSNDRFCSVHHMYSPKLNNYRMAGWCCGHVT